jgi:hypothetical protein
MTRIGEKGDAYRILVGKHLGKYPLGRQSRMLDDNIKMNLQETCCEDQRWMELAQYHI